jgi:hypothetical protein
MRDRAGRVSAVEVEVPRWALLEPEPVVLGGVLEELRGRLENIVAGLLLFLRLEFILLSFLVDARGGLGALRLRRCWLGWMGGRWSCGFGFGREIGRLGRNRRVRLPGKRFVVHKRITIRSAGRFVRRELFWLLDRP